jgi:hypothetical protein
VVEVGAFASTLNPPPPQAPALPVSLVPTQLARFFVFTGAGDTSTSTFHRLHMLSFPPEAMYLLHNDTIEERVQLEKSEKHMNATLSLLLYSFATSCEQQNPNSQGSDLIKSS